MSLPPGPTKLLRARAYVRVSYVGKNRQNSLLSDEMQLDEARRYAEYAGFAFDEAASRLHADLDVSGFKKPWRQRPGLTAHFEAARRGEFDVLIFYKISRLARNVREALDLIAEFEKLGVAFHFVAERIDSSSAQGRFLRNVLLSAAEMESENISEFLKAAFEKRARDGKHHGALPGWLRFTAQGEIETVPEVVAALRRMIELRLAGTGQLTIARILNEEGHLTAQGRPWTQSAVHKYLSEEWLRTMRGTSFFGRKRKDRIEKPGCFPPIVSESEVETLIALQKLYSAEYGAKGQDWWTNKHKARTNPRYSAAGHLLSSIVFCSRCGSRMIAWHSIDPKTKKDRTRYTCPQARSLHQKHPRGTGSVVDTMLEDAVLRVVRGALLEPPAPLEKQAQAAKVRTLEDVQKRIDKLVEMNLRGKLMDEDFTRHYDELLTERLRLAEDAGKDGSALAARAEELAARDDLTKAELRQLVLLMVERVEAPVFIEGVQLRSNVPSLVKFARVTLRFPRRDGHRVFMAQLHQRNYKGQRTYFAYPGELVGGFGC